MTQPINSGGFPSLSLGGPLGSSAAPPVPAGRSISSLRAPRGTNFIRLAFAAVFLLGFLGLVGFLLKDYLPGVFPSLAGLGETEEILADSDRTQQSQPAVVTTPLPGDSPNLTDTGNKKSAVPPASPALSNDTNATAKLTTTSSSFDPTEPVLPKSQPVTPPEITSAAPSPVPMTAPAESAVPADSLPKMAQASSDTLLEVSSKPSTNNGSSVAAAATPEAPMQTHVSTEDDAPPEAKPAVEALKKFLASSSLAERLQHTLGAEHMKPLMERYYTRLADGPVIVDRIQFVRMDPNPELGSGRHCIFSLENKTWEFPVPVMLEEQSDGFKVDWLAFVEFKDRLLEKFFQTYQEGPARFHVGIIRHHYFEDGIPNVDRKDAFRVMPAPPNSYQASVFLDKDSALAQELRARLPWETHVWAVVELEWKKLGSQQWVELSAVPQMHWYSLPMAPRPISTTQKTPENEELPPGITKNGARGKSGGQTGSGTSMPPPGIQKSSPGLTPTIKRPLPAGR